MNKPSSDQNARGVRAARQVSALRGVVLVAAATALGGCTIIPGVSGSFMRDQSRVELPVTQGDEQVPANVNITPITAELIIEQFKASQAAGDGRFRLGNAGGQTATRGDNTAPDPALNHADYRLGPGDIINVIVWDHPEITIPAGSYRSAEQSARWSPTTAPSFSPTPACSRLPA